MAGISACASWSPCILFLLCLCTLIPSPPPGPQSPDLDSPSLSNQHAPIPYDQLHLSSCQPPRAGTASGYSSGAESTVGQMGSLRRPLPAHPLRSFNVPGPPSPRSSSPNSPLPKQQIGTMTLCLCVLVFWSSCVTVIKSNTFLPLTIPCACLETCETVPPSE